MPRRSVVTVLVVACLLAVACQRYDPYAIADPAERLLLEKLERDRYVHLRHTHRNPDGSIAAWTEQGGELIRYRIQRPTPDAAPELVRLPNATPIEATIEPPEQPATRP